jgi:hypothetical protein
MAGNLIIFWSLPLSTLFCLGCHSAGGLLEVIIFWFPGVCASVLYVRELCERRRSQKLRDAAEAKRTAASAEATRTAAAVAAAAVAAAEEKKRADEKVAAAAAAAVEEKKRADEKMTSAEQAAAVVDPAKAQAPIEVATQAPGTVAEMAFEAGADPRSLEMFQKLAAEAEAAAAEASAAQHSRSAGEVEVSVQP